MRLSEATMLTVWSIELLCYVCWSIEEHTNMAPSLWISDSVIILRICYTSLPTAPIRSGFVCNGKQNLHCFCGIFMQHAVTEFL